MAKLLTSPYKGEWGIKDNESLSEYFDRTEAMFNAIPDDKIVSFPIADGAAFYFVASISPPRLQHIPYGDAWGIPEAHMRGLRGKDIQERIDRAIRIKKMFGG